MAILITGVAGFIGCNLAERLLSQGATVFGIDNLCRGSMSNLRTVLDQPGFVFSQLDM